MTFIYILSFCLLYLCIVLLKKNNKKIDLITSIIYTFGILFFYDSFIAFVLSYLKIKNSLFSFSLVYLVTSLVLIYINYKKHKKIQLQKYYLNKKHLAGLIFLIFICFILGAIKYSGFGEVDYEVTDAAVHYKASNDYGIYLNLFDDSYETAIYSLSHFMFGYYVPCGIFMQIIPLSNYICYNIFNTCMLCLLTTNFYVTCLEIKRHDKNNIFTIILTLLYALAYPLNYVLFGFGYLGSGILAVNLVLLTWKFILKDNRKSLYYLLALFNFGIFFSYYLFVPILYLAQVFFLIYKFLKDEYKFSKIFKIGVITLLVPVILGFTYFIFKGSIIESLVSSSDNYIMEGYSYQNLWGNFILLIPMAIYSITIEIKNKNYSFDIFIFIWCFMYIILTLILVVFGKVSQYYYYKPYYIMWLFVYIYIFKLINYKECKQWLKINYIFIIFIIIVSTFNVNKVMYNKNNYLNKNSEASILADIYFENEKLFNKSFHVPKSQLDLFYETIKYRKVCGIKKYTGISVAGNFLQKMWFYAVTDAVPVAKFGKYIIVNSSFIAEFKYEEFVSDENTKCLLILNDYEEENEINPMIDYEKYKILYKNKEGILLQKKF